MPSLNGLWTALLPELHEFQAAEWRTAVDAARRSPLDIVELLTLAATIVVATGVMRVVAEIAPARGFEPGSLYSIAAATAVTLSCLLAVQRRRLRRGLRQQIRQRQEAT